MWSFHGMEGRKFVQIVQVTWPIWLLCPYMAKHYSSLESKGRRPWNLVCSIKYSSTTKFIQMITLSWPWPFLRQGQMVPYILSSTANATLHLILNNSIWDYLRNSFQIWQRRSHAICKDNLWRSVMRIDRLHENASCLTRGWFSKIAEIVISEEFLSKWYTFQQIAVSLNSKLVR